MRLGELGDRSWAGLIRYLGPQFQQMMPTRLKSIFLNHGINELRLLQDGSIPITFQKWKKVVAVIGEQALTGVVGNDHQVLYAMFAQQPGPPLDRLCPAF